MTNVLFDFCLFQVEAGDIIVKINETDVIRCNTKEVLKCIRLSQNPVSLELKRDPVIKDKVRHLLFSPDCYPDENGDVICTQQNVSGVGSGLMSSEDYEPSPAPPPSQHPPPLNTVTRSNGASGGTMVTPPPRCEAFVMTGERVLNLTRTPQVSILPKQKKKIDSLCKNNYQHYHGHGPRHSSVPTSPIESHHHHHQDKHHQHSASCSPSPSPVNQQTQPYGVRSFKSEDTLSKNSNGDNNMDDDVMASMNTLLDTRPESDSRSNPTSSSLNNSLSSPTSPTSVSSSVMSSSNSTSAPNSSTERKRAFEDSSQTQQQPVTQHPGLTQQQPVKQHPGLVQQESLSQSEGISNISSPDFAEGDDTGGILSPRDLLMQVSDPSDSDSTLLVCEPKVRRTHPSNGSHVISPVTSQHPPSDHRLVIQVKGGAVEANNNNLDRKSCDPHHHNVDNSCDNNVQNSLANSNSASDEVEDPQLLALAEGAAQLARSISIDTTGSDDSDVDSLQSFHFSPKAVDYPSALRLAKRLYHLEGFKKSDVSRHLSKNNDFSRVVAEEYLKYFNFEEDSLDMALRKFLKQFVLIGETQERERVLIHFSKRYLDYAVHTLTCAIMLLNTDLHAQVIGRKMTCTEFIENLADLNDGENFPREILKQLYHAIKSNPLEWAVDDDEPVMLGKGGLELPGGTFTLGKEEQPQTAVEYKKGYVKRKCCIDPNGKRTPLGKRGWKMYYCTLRDLVLYLHKDETETRTPPNLCEVSPHTIRIHHSLATKATEYRKKQHVFKLETADRAEYLFQTSDSKELQSWIDTLNFVAALLSAQPLPGGIGSQKKFQRPLLPSSHTRLNPREQMKSHEDMVQHLEQELDQHKLHPPDKHAKGLTVQNYKDKNSYLQSEIKRYKIYSYILSSKLSGVTNQALLSGGGGGGLIPFDNFSLMFPPAHLTLHEGGEMTEEGEGEEENSSPNHHNNNNSRQQNRSSPKKNANSLKIKTPKPSKSPVLSRKKAKNKS
ncbi:hypothetical protein M8J75_006036 [Diaphorina citri]|nr:hypothetical protein M8J75_006036 [Diaphorina citri]